MGDDWIGEERRDPVSLSDVHAGIVEVARSMTELAEAITKSARNRSILQSAWLGLLTVMILVVGGIGLRTNSIASAAQDTNETIQDCSTPGGACFARNLAVRNAAAVQAVAQFECDAGRGCSPGVTPGTSLGIMPGTTSTTTTTAVAAR